MLTTFDLPEVEDMWTLVGKTDEKKRRDGLPDHSFLILSRRFVGVSKKLIYFSLRILYHLVFSLITFPFTFSDSSLILRTEEEINELEESGFNTSAKTVFAGNIGNNRYIIQVTALNRPYTNDFV